MTTLDQLPRKCVFVCVFIEAFVKTYGAPSSNNLRTRQHPSLYCTSSNIRSTGKPKWHQSKHLAWGAA